MCIRDRYRNIDKKHGAILAPCQKAFGMFAAEYWLGRAGGRNYDVGAIASFVELVEADGFAAKLGRQLHGSFMSAIRHENTGRTLRLQVARRQFAHLPGADPVSYTHLTLPTILRV